jgi:uncharacterized UPF0160 family protein
MDIICDVGSVFDPERNRLDHHQKSFTLTWEDFEDKKVKEVPEKKEVKEEKKEGLEEGKKKTVIKLSSAGLVYRFYGKEIIQQICKTEYEKELDDETLEYVYQKMYNKLIKEIDAIDNGVNIGSPNYNINSDLSYRVSFYNLPWNAPTD